MRRTGPRARALRSAAVFCVTVSLLFQLPSASAARRAQAPVDKEALTQRMIELEAEIQALTPQVTNNRGERKLQTLYDEYDAISAQMGGDRAPLTSKQTEEASAPESGVPTPPDCLPVFHGPFANDTNVTISASGTPTVTSTINVVGVGTYLWDLNVFTDIEHTFNNDLDITVTSPAGTVVTLTTDNGGVNDNVFAGTTWDDDVNPGGQVPFTTNNGTVTDHSYVNNVVVPALTPEEALAAFNGENPNGTWTLTISDDLGGDGGLLDSWSISFATLAFTPTNTTTTVPSANVPVNIASGQPSVATSTLVVSGVDTFLCDVNVLTSITHTSNDHLDITIQSPSGTVVTLTSDNGGSNDNVFNGTTWDDDANPLGQVPYATNNGLVNDHAYVNNTVATPLAPEEPLGAFIGEDPNGTWTLSISDDTNGMGGNLSAWSLQITTCTCECEAMCPADIVVAESPAGSGGAVVTYDPPTTTGNCGTIVCSPASGSVFPVGTTTVTCSEVFIDSSEGIGQELCSFTVTVTAGCTMITCPANVTQGNDPGQCGAVVNYPVPTGDPGCGEIVCTPVSGSFFPVGTTTVTCEAQGGGGGQTEGGLPTCSFTVTVNDTQPPTITCPANVTQGNDPNQCGAVVNYPAPTFSDNCPGASVVCSPVSGSFFPVGTTTVTCTATDASMNTASCSFTVTVNDTQPPTITCPANVTQGNDPNQCGAVVNYPAPTFSDNCPGATVVCSPVSGSFFPVGTTTVTCTATDASMNTASCSFTVTVNDIQAPAITCPANITTTGNMVSGCTLSAVVNYPAPTVSDNCPGVGAPVCVPASGSAFPEGTTTVTCTVADTAGNTAACSFTVTVTAVGAFGACAVDDASGDTWSIVTDPASPIYRFWRYRVAATGELFCGTASSMAHYPGRSLTAADNDDTRFFMNANLNFGASAGTVRVVDYATGRQFNLKDRNLRNNPPCN